MKKIWEDFKSFAFKGNVIDMAVGVVIGGAFSKIVTSIVGDLIMPIVGYITAGVNFQDLKWVIGDKVMENGEKAAIAYGAFIQNVIDFFIIAVCIFLAVRLIEKLRRKQEEQPETPAAPSEDIVLLTEIRDLLKSQNQPKQDES